MSLGFQPQASDLRPSARRPKCTAGRFYREKFKTTQHSCIRSKTKAFKPFSMSLSKTSDRIQVIDVLRGFALLGIVLVHMVEQYYAGPMPESITSQLHPSIADHIAQGFTTTFIMGKFYMIFSFLFGLSFFIQFSKHDGNFVTRFTWRLTILFIIGMIHHLHYRGDILTIYAMLGLPLLLLHRLPDKSLLVLSLVLILNIPTVIMRTVQLITGVAAPDLFAGDQSEWLAYFNTVKSGAYPDILVANLYSFDDKMLFQVLFGRLYITLGLFLLGVYAGRKKLFERIDQKLISIKKARNFAWLTVLGCIVLTGAIFGLTTLMKLKLSQEAGMLIGGFFFDTFNSALAVVYFTVIVLLFQKQKWHERLMVFYGVGRMGLTTYVMQSAIGTFIFFSFGLGLINEIGALMSLLLGIAIFVVQIVFANYWFRYYAYGPLEWLWRSLTYLKVQRLKAVSSV
jgi:uncharacterized protein